MRGATQDECARVAERGEALRVGRSNVLTEIPDGVGVIFGLTANGGLRELVYATPGTMLVIVDVRKAIWPKDVEVIFGRDQAVGTQLMAWQYLDYLSGHSANGPLVACFCFWHTRPGTIIMPWQLGGVGVVVQAVPPPLPRQSAEDTLQRLAPPL